MTQEEKDAIAGRTRREYRDAKQHLAALRAKARPLGEMLVEMGKLLIAEPESVIFQGQSHAPDFSARGRVFQESDFDSVTAAKLRQSSDEVRAAIVRTKQLREQLTQIEGEDPERRP